MNTKHKINKKQSVKKPKPSQTDKDILQELYLIRQALEKLASGNVLFKTGEYSHYSGGEY